jgi:hypothetical protein
VAACGQEGQQVLDLVEAESQSVSGDGETLGGVGSEWGWRGDCGLVEELAETLIVLQQLSAAGSWELGVGEGLEDLVGVGVGGLSGAAESVGGGGDVTVLTVANGVGVADPDVGG